MTLFLVRKKYFKRKGQRFHLHYHKFSLKVAVVEKRYIEIL